MVGKEKLGREPGGHPDIPAIAKLYGQELASGFLKQPEKTEAAEPELKVHNLLEADASQVALLKNTHMKLGCMCLGFACKYKHFRFSRGTAVWLAFVLI